MRKWKSAIALLGMASVAGILCAQATPDIGELRAALVGSWVGTLEYRDYAEPATSTKRVKLPTWLRVEASAEDLNFRYVYDDGPAKTVTEISVIRIEPDKHRYSVLNRDGKVEDVYTMAGFAELKQGRGTLTLAGPGTENKVTVDVRTTIRIGRNILEITRETAAAGQSFTFRHAYTFVRETPPAPAPIK